MSCEEAKHLCDKAQYDEASLFDKIKLSLRISYCKVTKAYYKRNNKLTEKLKESKVECLTPECKKNMKKEFDLVLKEHTN